MNLLPFLSILIKLQKAKFILKAATAVFLASPPPPFPPFSELVTRKTHDIAPLIVIDTLMKFRIVFFL
jgi:hypothetical protein